MTKRNNIFREPFNRRAFLKVFGLTVGSIGLTSLAGCRDTDTLTEVVHTDWAEEIDYDTDIKTYKNVPDSDLETASLPKLKETDADAVDEKVELPSYDEKAKPNGEAMQTETSKDTQKKEDNTQSDEDEPDDSDDGAGEETEGDSGETGEGEETDGEGEGEDDEEYGQTSATISENGDIGDYPQSDVSAAPEFKGAVIAFGEMANLVAMLGGRGALFACEDAFLETAADYYDSRVLADVGNGFIEKYARSGKTMTSAKFKELLAAIKALEEDSRPKYLIYDMAIGCPVTDDQSKALEDKYGIVTLKFSLKTVALLKNAMNYIQKILVDFGAKSVYDAYWKFHDGLLDALNSKCGGVAAWTTSDGTSNMSFRTGTSLSGGKVMDQEQTMWTLLISDWDRKVTYDAKGLYGLSASNGLGISTLGWNWSPVNYYLQCGGVINNAAARYQVQHTFSSKKTYRRYVWQMHRSYGLPGPDTLTGGVLGSDDAINANAGTNGTAEILMLAQNEEFGLGNKGGVKRFPGVIVTNSDDEASLKADMKRSTGVYAAHYLEAGATPNNTDMAVMGLNHKSSGSGKGALWRAYVGFEGEDAPASAKYEDTDKPYEVYVNPHGVYSNWISGCAESVLEAVWAYAVFQQGDVDASLGSTGYGSTAADVVSYFYETFYGKAPSSSMCKKILSGGYSAS